MSTGTGKKLYLYFSKEFVKEFGEFHLNTEELYILLGKGRKLFEFLQHTLQSTMYLEQHPDLKEVIEKW